MDHEQRKKAIWKESAVQVVTALLNESERAIPLIACQWLDDSLETLLGERFKAQGINVDDRKRLVNGWNSVLGSFASRILICKAFDVLPKEECDAMDALRNIRNHSAHHPDVVSLDDPEIAKPVRALRAFAADRFDAEAKFTVSYLVISTTSYVGGIIHYTINAIRNPGESRRSPQPDKLLGEPPSPKNPKG